MYTTVREEPEMYDPHDDACEDTYLTHYENDVFDEGDCEETDLDEDEMEAAIAAAEAEYDAHVNA
jgi:hypothetical protein